MVAVNKEGALGTARGWENRRDTIWMDWSSLDDKRVGVHLHTTGLERCEPKKRPDLAPGPQGSGVNRSPLPLEEERGSLWRRALRISAGVGDPRKEKGDRPGLHRFLGLGSG